MSNLSQFLNGVSPKAQYFSASGTFVKPALTNWVTALLVGGGQGGTGNFCFRLGGSGAETKFMPLYLTANSTITIGAGSTVGLYGGNTTATNNGPFTAVAHGGGVMGRVAGYYLNGTTSVRCGLSGTFGTVLSATGGAGSFFCNGYFAGHSICIATCTSSGGGGSFGPGGSYQASASLGGGGGGGGSVTTGGNGLALIFYMG